MQAGILEIHDLTVSFRVGKEIIKAVDHVSLTLKKGCTTGIVGESGSGKSVTALSVMRLLPAHSAIVEAGRILLTDEAGITTDLSTLDERQMRHIRGNRISMIFQEPMTSLNPVKRCGYQVTEAIRAHRTVSSREARRKAIELFNEVLLPQAEEIFYAYPHELSGGQKQRVMIAMAVASHPDILIADEPTTALDVTVQKSILELLKKLQLKYGMAVLFITHDLGLISGIADDLVVMKDGQIVESGPAKDIFSHPQHPYTRGLLACRPPLDISVDKLMTVDDFLKQGPNGPDADFAYHSKRDERLYQLKLEEIYSRDPMVETVDLKTYFPLKKRFARRRSEIKAVDGISVKIFPGEVLGLVGESGCGKTTLGRSILRLIEPTGGRIRFHGRDITGISSRDLKRMRKDIQIIFQDPYSSLNPNMTVGNAITEPMKVHGIGHDRHERKEIATGLLEKVGLDRRFYNRYPHELSGGQRQRVCIARALSVRPGFIICDESVSALDVSVQAQVLNLLKELKDEFQITYIFISHDLSVVRFISDRIAVMKDGKIIETGPADEIYRKPKSDYTKKLIAAIPS